MTKRGNLLNISPTNNTTIICWCRPCLKHAGTTPSLVLSLVICLTGVSACYIVRASSSWSV